MAIYAGRTETPRLNKHIMTYEEMAARAKEQGNVQEDSPRVQQVFKDKVTFSQEGMKSAREMREYLNKNGLNSARDIKAEFEELDKQLRTKSMDYTNNFLSEMQEVINEERETWGSEAAGHSFDNSLALMSKAYQVVHDRIVDEFAREDRETTYVIDKDTGARREETVDDRLAELDLAYDRHTTFVAASKKVMAQIKETFGGVKLPEKPKAIEKKTKEAYMEAVSEKNLQRMRQKADSFQDYRPQLSIGSYWENILRQIW